MRPDREARAGAAVLAAGAVREGTGEAVGLLVEVDVGVLAAVVVAVASESVLEVGAVVAVGWLVGCGRGVAVGSIVAVGEGTTVAGLEVGAAGGGVGLAASVAVTSAMGAGEPLHQSVFQPTTRTTLATSSRTTKAPTSQ